MADDRISNTGEQNGADAGGGLRASAYRGAAATAVQQGVRILMQVASLVVLARVLSPEDFGVFAMVAPVMAVVSMFQGMGLHDAIIRRRDVTDAQINTLYWVNVAFTAAIALTLVLIAPALAWFYKEPRVAALTAAWAVPVLIGAFSQQQYTLLTRDLRFVTLAAIDIACVLAGFVVAVAAALIWKSYWAMWISGVASSLLWTVASTAVSRWRPSAPWRTADTEGLLAFGAKMTGVGLLEFAADNIDKVLIGRFAGAAALGFYDRAFKLLLFPMQNVSWPLGRVAMPLLARLRDDPARFRAAYLAVVGQINFIAVPAVAAALATHGEVIRVLLGPEWAPSAEIFAWLGLAALVQPMTASTYWLFTLQGRTRAMLQLAAFNGVVVIAATLIGLQDGALGVARAFAIAECAIRVPMLIQVVCRSGPIRRIDFALAIAPFALGACVIWGIAQSLMAAGLEGVLLLGTVGTLSYAVTVVAMLAFGSGRETLREAMAMAGRALSLARRAAPA